MFSKKLATRWKRLSWGLVAEVEFIESYEGKKTVDAVHQFLEQRGL